MSLFELVVPAAVAVVVPVALVVDREYPEPSEVVAVIRDSRGRFSHGDEDTVGSLA